MALGIDYNSGIPHTNGAPTHDPGTNGGKLAYDHVNRVKYKHVSGTTWEVDASGGGGGGVATVTGAPVDNTDPLNPVINAIPLNATGAPVTAYTGSSVWRTSVPLDDYYEGGVAWDKFMDKPTAIMADMPGAFCWYSGVDGSYRSFFQSNPQEGYFEFGGTNPGGGYSSLLATYQGIKLVASGLGTSAGIDLRGNGVMEFYCSTFFDFGTTAPMALPRLNVIDRDALTPSEGYIIYCTDATANDSSTGVTQTYNGTSWKNHW